MKKLLCILLAALMLWSVASLAFAEEEHGPYWIGDYTLTWWVPIDGTAAQHMESYAEHPFLEWMKEQTGVSIEFIHYSYEQQDQQFNLMVVSDNYYDLLYGPDYPGGPQQAILDGVFADIYEFRDIMPHYFAAVECGDASFSEWEWGVEKDILWQGAQPAFADLLTTVQGNMWTVSEIWTDTIPAECGALIRKDWLDEAGLDIPTTVDELETVLAAFAARGDDVIPMSMDSSGANGSDGFLQTAFDVFYNWYYVKDGVVQPGDACGQPGLKAYVEKMADWYAKGYIDRDFMNRDFEGREALLLSDRLGLFTETWADPAYYQNLYEGSSENFELVAIPNVKLTEDQQLHFRQAYGSSNSNNSCIYAGSELKEVAARYLDVLYTKEAILRGQYGIEGESYVLEDGVPYFTEWFYEHLYEDDLNSVYLKPGVITGYWSTRADILKSAVDTSIEGQKTVAGSHLEASRIWSEGSDVDYMIGYVTFDGDGWGQMYDPFVEADTYFATQVLRMITGAESVEKFDEISKTAWDMGFDLSRQLMQESYNSQHQLPEGTGMDYEFGT